MRKMLAVSTILAICTFAAQAAETPAAPAEEISCHIKSLESKASDAHIVSLSIHPDGTASFTVDYKQWKGTVVESKTMRGEKVEELKKMWRENLSAFEDEEGGYFLSDEERDEFLNIERPYYTDTLDRTVEVNKSTFSDEFMLLRAYHLYDKDGVYLASYVINGYRGIFNFCIPN